MQRILAAVVVAVFIAGPAPNLQCLLSCAPVTPASALSESCHHSASPERSVSGVGDCADRLLQPPAVAAKRLDGASRVVVSTVAVEFPGQPTSDVSSESVLFDLSAARPPLPHVLIALRI